MHRAHANITLRIDATTTMTMVATPRQTHDPPAKTATQCPQTTYYITNSRD